MAIPPTAVIIAAAGEGRRLGSSLPKALVPLGGIPLFLHSARIFASLPFVRTIVVAAPPRWIEQFERAWSRGGVRRVVVPGGARRQDSVRAGLGAAEEPVVLVHDAARPFVRPAAIRAVALAAARHGASVLAAPAVDTIKIADGRGRVLSTPDRSRVWHAQTPQGFRREILLAAYRAAGRAAATDDAQIVERAGGKVVIVPSDGSNFKITTASDLARAEKALDRA